jgi:hypothetical protein
MFSREPRLTVLDASALMTRRRQRDWHRSRDQHHAMTQQYIVGEFSSLLAELGHAPEKSLADDLESLRREVECAAPTYLPKLVRDAITLTDWICWTALEQGDGGGFDPYARGAARLHQFSDNANVQSEAVPATRNGRGREGRSP